MMKKVIFAAITVSVLTLSSAWAAENMKEGKMDNKDTKSTMTHKETMGDREMKSDAMGEKKMPMEEKETMEMKKDEVMEKKS